jgi:diaminopimelate epimerase
MASSLLSFGKYQGLGNDFLVVDLRAAEIEPSPEQARGDTFYLAHALCDRRFGVGGDGVLSLSAPRSKGAAATMRVLNADGSEAEMCGNGIRCVVKYLLELDRKAPGQQITIDTGAGPLTCTAQWSGDEVTGVTVDMGRPRTARGEVPMAGPADEEFVDSPIELESGTRRFTAVSMGNPHAITFVDESADALLDLARHLGPGLERHELFPNRTNVEFACVHASEDIELVVWERGCGITLACGTGACATAVAACRAGHSSPGTPIRVRLLGGELIITVADDYSTVLMQGPAEHVYDGTIDLTRFA